MSDIPDGFTINNPDPELKKIEETLKALVKEVRGLTSKLSKSQKSLVSSVDRFASLFEEKAKKDEESDKKQESQQEEILRHLSRDIDKEKQRIKGFEDILTAIQDNAEWAKLYHHEITKAVKPLAVEANKEYVNANRKLVDSQTGDSILNEVIRHNPVLGLLLGKSTGGPGGHDTFMRGRKEDITRSVSRGFSEKAQDKVSEMILTKDQYASYKEAKERKLELENYKRREQAGLGNFYDTGEAKPNTPPPGPEQPQSNREDTRGKTKGRETEPQPTNVYPSLDTFMNSFKGKLGNLDVGNPVFGPKTKEETIRPSTPKDPITGKFTTKEQAESSAMRKAMGNTSSFSESDIRSLPFAYGGPALFLANQMREILGTDEKKKPGETPIQGKGIIGDTIDTLSKLLPTVIPAILGAIASAGGVGAIILSALPFAIAGGAVAMVAGVAMNYFDKDKKLKDGLLASMTPELKKKLEASTGKKVEDLDVSTLKTGFVSTDTKLPTYGGDVGLQKELGSKGVGPAALFNPDAEKVYKDLAPERNKTQQDLLKKYGITPTKGKTPGSVIDLYADSLAGKYFIGGKEVPKDDYENVKQQKVKLKEFIFNKEDPKDPTYPRSRMQFHSGGVVPGSSSMEVPSVLLGGERVLSHDQNKNIEALLSQMVEGQKELIKEMKNNTKVTDAKDLSVPAPSSSVGLSTSVGVW